MPKLVSKYRELFDEIANDPNTAITYIDVVCKPGCYSIILFFDDTMCNPHEIKCDVNRIKRILNEYKQTGHCRWELMAPSVQKERNMIAENLTKYREMANEFDNRYGRVHSWRM